LFQNNAFAQDNGTTIRVGIFQNQPIVFIDDNGVPQGLYIDLLREIANDEGWDIKFVPGTWAEGLERLRSTEIDLMTSIAYLDEREVYMDFSHENVLTMWGQVYVHQDSDIQDILDLQGETVAILNGGINGINFMDMASKFDIQCEFTVAGTYTEVAELVASGSVAAGVINNVHGYEEEKQYAIKRSPIIFNPFSLLFVVPEGKNRHLLETIDSYLAKWKSDPESPYYSITAKWFGQKEKEVLPDWVFRALLFGVGILLLVTVWVFILRHQVNIRTKKLTESGEVLRKSEALLAESQRIGHIGSWELNLVSNVLTWSDEVYRMFELEPQQFGATYEAFLDNIHPDDREMVNQAYTESVRSKTPYNIVHRLLLRGGNVKYVNEKCETFYSDDGKPIRSLGTMQDITERKRAEEELKRYHEHLEELVKKRTSELEGKTGELEQANIRLQELDLLKSMFIASMSHELRTPLNSIIGFTGIILQGISGKITEDQRKELTMVKNSAHHLLTLINDIIDVSKIETGKVELFIEEFNLADLMQEVKESFKVAADEKNLKLSLKMPERLIIKSDERRTKQVIMNLGSNAVKFTDRGEIEIKVKKKDEKVVVSVADTGIGIKKENMEKLFKQFSRIYAEGIPVIEGTGLGLYLSKKIVDLLGGQIKAESEFGKGSMFTFTFPLEYREVKT
jgi:PAS domain S-box-containing protein